ncbi:N-methyl-L-tryptophan oxidase [Gulosibacter sediminis]|uniref:N-methyl-L-tryptophan oxidase n=1 Tax=Gulosibacter sediminis TaxID=1729695 RepID=UPI0024A96F41|nr:N-methyl-L-tryptophan oxidase [Gulosibacter sediminis]
MAQHKPTIVVIGLGSVGSMTAWQLAKRQEANVIGIEQYGRVHSHGSYAGESRVFRAAYHEGGLYVPMLLESRELWRELQVESGREIYLEAGTLSIAQESQPEFQTTLDCVRDYDLPHRVFSTEELRKAYPQHNIFDGDVAVLDEYGGGLRPEVAIMSALELAENAGADLRFNTEVLGLDEQPGGVAVRTSQGTIQADKVIVASGSWTKRVLPGLDALLRLLPLGLTWFMVKDPSQFTPDKFPTFLRDHGSTHFFGVPTLDGYSIKASGNPVWPVERDVADVPTEYTSEQLNLLGQRAAELLNGINPEPVRASVHHCAYTPNRLPVLDLSPSERIIVAAGLSGHGFKFATAFGAAATELALEGEARFGNEAFTLAAHFDYLAEHGAYSGTGH